MIKPLFNQILVAPKKEELGLLTPEDSYLNYGEVIDTGDEVKKIKVGDTICFTVWGLNHVEINDKKYYFVAENSSFILGKIENDQ